MIDWGDGIGAAIGSVLGSAATILGFRGRIGALEKECDELRRTTRAMFEGLKKDMAVVSEDIKKLIARTANRRKDD